jgi:hypothetical protein
MASRGLAVGWSQKLLSRLRWPDCRITHTSLWFKTNWLQNYLSLVMASNVWLQDYLGWLQDYLTLFMASHVLTLTTLVWLHMTWLRNTWRSSWLHMTSLRDYLNLVIAIHDWLQDYFGWLQIYLALVRASHDLTVDYLTLFMASIDLTGFLDPIHGFTWPDCRIICRMIPKPLTWIHMNWPHDYLTLIMASHELTAGLPGPRRNRPWRWSCLEPSRSCHLNWHRQRQNLIN